MYIYYEIAKNPPQPYFDNNYFDKVDLEKSFDEINITNVSYYQFFQKIKAKLSDYKDINTNIYFFEDNKKLYILNDLYSFIPLKFNIRKINESYEIFSELFKKENFINYFDKKIIDSIKENKDQPILSINGQEPTDFISNFCGNINSYKNPHATFTHKFNHHNWNSLLSFPLDYKDLNIEIIYKNGNRLNVSYIIVSQKEIKELNSSKIMKKNTVLSNNHFYKNIKPLQWDDEVKNGFKCRIDKENKVNIYYFKNGINEQSSLIDYKGTLFYCTKLFDENDYPILVIFGETIKIFITKIFKNISLN